jgi:2-methylisocitrate lyase-like PEP mutase family enzyme
MTMNDIGRRFRALHDREGAFVIPNPWDVGSARILAGMGFEALASTSAGLAFSLGLPEGKVPRGAVIRHCRELVAATPLPVSADLEKGFGDSPESVAETIHAAAKAGLAGCSIEDHTGRREDSIFDQGLAIERIAAAVEARRGLGRDFVLTARCENLLWGRPELDDVIDRLRGYEAAGADVLYAPGLRDLGDIRTVCAALARPVNVVMGMPGPTFSVEELANAGVKRISVGSTFARCAYGSLIDAATEITQEGTFGFARLAKGFAELEAFFGAADT